MRVNDVEMGEITDTQDREQPIHTSSNQEHISLPTTYHSEPTGLREDRVVIAPSRYA